MLGWNRKSVALVYCTSTFAMNCQVSQVTGFSPFQMVYSKPPPDKLAFDFDPLSQGSN